MSIRKVYVSGPMTGMPDLNFPAFRAAARKLRQMGFSVVNPADSTANEGKAWAECLRNDITNLMTCDAVVMLPGWTKSRGARLERALALRVEMPVVKLEEADQLLSEVKR
jgi:hypothetical protein